MLDIVIISVILAAVLVVCGWKVRRVIKGGGGCCAGCSGCFHKDECPGNGEDIT